MTEEEADEYWAPARRKCAEIFKRPGGSHFSGVALARLIGFKGKYHLGWGWVNIALTDDVKRKLIMLAGPHYRTIIAAIKAREDLNEEQENRTDLPKTG